MNDSAATGRAQFAAITFEDGILTIKPVGPSVGQREAPIITEDATQQIDGLSNELRALVIDLSDVAMVTSMGLGMCIDLQNKAKKAKAKSVLFGTNDDVFGVFKMMKIDKLYKVAKSNDDLVKFTK